MPTTNWTKYDMPDLPGKRFLVTGGNSGIGYEAALALAEKHAAIILAVRNLDKGSAAAEQIKRANPHADVEVMLLDLADLASVRRMADEFHARHDTLHGLINNAGVMALPYRQTVDGFEMQFGVNHLGHFALTGLLLPAILATPAARVITVSSGAHQRGKINFDDLQSKKRYQQWNAYSNSKLANLLFAYELQRRFEQTGASAISVACHPGYAATNLQAMGPRMEGSRLKETFMQILNNTFAQTAEQGALATLYAAASPDAKGGDYIGPTGWNEMRGSPGKVRSIRASYDLDTARRLWEVSEELTGVRYMFPEPAAA